MLRGSALEDDVLNSEGDDSPLAKKEQPI